jgi:hypothetical protein
MTDDAKSPGQQLQTGEGSVADRLAPARDAGAAAIVRGVMRLLAAHDIAAVAELPLPDGRRADLVGLSADGMVTLVEVKSCLADFRADQKWPEYRAFCDRLYFAVDSAFPAGLVPTDTGLIIADRYGGAFERDAPIHALAPARRKAMILRFARAAAWRHSLVQDPGLRRDEG